MMSQTTKKRVIVTGGTGYVGRALLHDIRNFHLDSLEVIALVRPSSDVIGLKCLLDQPSRESSVLVVDFENVDALTEAIKDADIVIHLAADMDFFPSDENALIERNLSLTRAMLDAAANESARSKRTGGSMRFLYVSSTEAIGPTAENACATEDWDMNPTSAYGRSKKLCEQLVLSRKSQVEVVIARPTGVYGPGERFFFYELIKLVACGLTIIAPSPMTGRVIFTHIDDVVQGLLLCATNSEANGVYNLCADTAITQREVVACISDALDYPRPRIFLPLSVGKGFISLIAPFMNLGKRRTFVFHAKTVSESMENRDYSNLRLKSLGFLPKYSMRSGIEQTVAHELRTGGLRRSRIPPAIHRCVQIISIAVFSVSRLILGKRQRAPT